MEPQEIRNLLLEHEERLSQVEDSLKELEILRQIAADNLLATFELRKSIDVLSRDFEKFRDEMKAFKDEMKVFKDEMGAFKDEMKAFKDEMKAFKDEMNKKWGELANRLGTIVEDIFAPGMPYLVQNLGYDIKKSMLDVTYKKGGRVRQYDAIIMAADDRGQEVVFVAEVKNQARAEDFERLKGALEELLFFEPEMKEKKVVPILAAFRIAEDLINLANKRGVLLVRMGGEYLEALNPEVMA